MADIIIIIVLVAVVYFMIRGQLHRRSSGEGSGCSGCAGCSGGLGNCCSCGSRKAVTSHKENGNRRRQE